MFGRARSGNVRVALMPCVDTGGRRRETLSARVGAPPVRGKGDYSRPIGFVVQWPAPSSSLYLSGLQALWEEAMPRRFTPQTALEHLKKEAKRWLKALRANDAEARSRFERAFPNPQRIPTLRDVQHALAREHGFRGWNELKNGRRAARAVAEAPGSRSRRDAGGDSRDRARLSRERARALRAVSDVDFGVTRSSSGGG